MCNATPTVNPCFRILLLSDSRNHTDEIWRALHKLQSSPAPNLSFQLFHFPLESKPEAVTTMLDLLDHVQAGYFDTVFILPSTGTWSQKTHASTLPQPRVRSRSQPLGLDSLDQLGRTVAEQSNKQLEFCAWVAEQALHCSTASLILIIPEDCGEHSMEDPPSPWCFREFMTLDSLHEAKRGSAFASHLFSADTSSVLGILSDIQETAAKLALGWPSHSAVGNSMVYSGPNPSKCSCALPHTVPIQYPFWQCLITAAASHTVSEALWDGTATSSSISARRQGLYTHPMSHDWQPHQEPPQQVR